ncbi:uncharacterized protein [Rutidosis leptorrhynchoides]|uniref:uncharacterized protein n=1 Tax=Rutidosis leptorrhynchoides TaxID=125765 RepID=UPI003A9A20DB
MAELKNLKQSRSVQTYKDEFEVLLNKVKITIKQGISLFLASLQKEIELPVRMFRPKSLEDAYCLAKLQEDTITATKKRFTPLLSTPRTTYSDDGLDGSEVDEPAIQITTSVHEDIDVPDEVIEYSPQISLHALTGTTDYQTMRVYGHINKKVVHILIYSGSTHNFLDLEFAKKVGCLASNMSTMQVCIPGGNKITSSGECKQFQWQMNGKEFIDDMVIIPIRGCDMVLGIQWLKKLGNIIWNFDELKMVFTYNKDRIVLRGKKAPLQWVKGKQMDKSCV